MCVCDTDAIISVFEQVLFEEKKNYIRLAIRSSRDK